MEEKVAGASYLLTFLTDIEYLIAYASNYINLYVQLKNKYDENTLQKDDIDENDKKNLIDITNSLRSITFKVFIRFNALTKEIKEFKRYKTEIKYKTEIRYRETQKFITIWQYLITQGAIS